MKTKGLSLLLLFLLISMTFVSLAGEKEFATKTNDFNMHADSILRHVVLLKFKHDTSKEDIKKVEDAFSTLPSKISEIHGYEWGLNNSPEGLEKGFTHCFFLTFKSEKDRAIYLPHPDHKAFGEVLGPHLEDVLVIDYWTK